MGAVRVFGSPAHAGMDRVWLSGCFPSRRLPRPRGDGPPSPSAPLSHSPAPPPTRGWTLPGGVPTQPALGSPAHAGMDLWPSSSPASREAWEAGGEFERGALTQRLAGGGCRSIRYHHRRERWLDAVNKKVRVRRCRLRHERSCVAADGHQPGVADGGGVDHRSHRGAAARVRACAAGSPAQRAGPGLRRTRARHGVRRGEPAGTRATRARSVSSGDRVSRAAGAPSARRDVPRRTRDRIRHRPEGARAAALVPALAREHRGCRRTPAARPGLTGRCRPLRGGGPSRSVARHGRPSEAAGVAASGVAAWGSGRLDGLGTTRQRSALAFAPGAASVQLSRPSCG